MLVADQPAAVPAALSINGCAKMLGISRDTVYRLARERKLRLVKLGTRTVVPVSEIERVLAPPVDAASRDGERKAAWR